MPVLMEQCEWCASEIINILDIYVIEQSYVQIRICHNCRHSKVYPNSYQHIKRYISRCDRQGEYNIYTTERMSRIRQGWTIASRARELKG